MLTKTLTTDDLAGQTVASAEEKGGAEGRAKAGQGGPAGTEDEEGVVVGRNHAAKGRRVAKCGEWIRLGEVAGDVLRRLE